MLKLVAQIDHSASCCKCGDHLERCCYRVSTGIFWERLLISGSNCMFAYVCHFRILR